MPSIAILTAHARFPWLRQIAGGGDSLGGFRFTLGSIAEDCAFLVVYDEPGQAFETSLARERRLLVISEPPGIKTYSPTYLEQFGTVLGPVEPIGYSGCWIASQPGLPWFFGVGFEKSGLTVNLDFDALAALPPPEKVNAISVVISGKTQLAKHRARLAFVEKLKARLGDRLHLFGNGFRAIGDKAEAILPYAYHLVLENNDIPHFWTEKTADAYLGWAFPVFSGCDNLHEYMPEGSFLRIDIDNHEPAIRTIEALLESESPASRLAAISQARHQVMNEYNLFAMLTRQAAALPQIFSPLAKPEIITPATTRNLIQRLQGWIKRAVKTGENRGA